MERNEVTLDDIERRLLAQHVKPHYDWIRHVVGLCVGSLTILVALQTHYIPKSPRALWLLALCWGLLALAVLAGLVALRGEDKTPLDAAQDLRRMRHELGDQETAKALMKNCTFAPRPIFKWARQTMIVFFSVAVALLAAFAILNIER